MRTASLLRFWIVLAFGASAEQVVFDADKPDDPHGLQLVQDIGTEPRYHKIGDLPVVSPPALSSDNCAPQGLAFHVPDDFPAGVSDVYLVVEHLDVVLDLIRVSYRAASAGKGIHAEDGLYAEAAALAGYISLGANTPRRALFHLSRLVFGGLSTKSADFKIFGVEGIRRVLLKTSLEDGEAEAVASEIPYQMSARVSLSQPMQLVMSVGADAKTPEGLSDSLKTMRELCPFAAALGFNGVESYVKWNFVESEKGRFDWSFYDAVVEEAGRYGLKWFPLLIAGSAYTLPAWYHDSPENVGFVCLEHGKGNNIQTIFCENQTPHVQRFLAEFGKHYEPGGRLLGVRLGPSGNFGESQYPAGGNWGYAGETEHIHIGWWAGDAHAAKHFAAWLRARYESIETLNKAWNDRYTQWNEVKCFIPQFAESARKRKDFVDWYMGAMTDWCERWALWAREAMPNTPIYQSAGGWGFVESGTDFTDQTQSMSKIGGGIRATNETDSYAQNFQVTRMMSSAARFYGVPFGSEPAGFNSAKGVASRIYNILVNNGQHLFFYYPNVLNHESIQTWLELAPLLDARAEPVIDVAVLYPDTQSKLDDGVFRNLYASSFYQRIGALRPHLDFDFCSERMVLEGALSRYKVLILAWSPTVEATALDTIDRWVRDGGTVLCMYWNRLPLQTVEEDQSVQTRWLNGDTGRGRAVMINEDREPPHRFADRVKQELLAFEGLDPLTEMMLRTEKPTEVYVSALKTGSLAILNYSDAEAEVRVPDQPPCAIAPYRIKIIPIAPAQQK